MSGVNLDLFDTNTLHSVDFATFYLGFQPGTDLTQTQTLTFANVVGGAVPEPSTWMLLLAGFTGLGFAGLARSRRRAEVAA